MGEGWVATDVCLTSWKWLFYIAGMIDRAYGAALRALLRRVPAVTILGPRPCGKTTFIRRELSD